MSFTVFQASCLCHCVPLLLAMIACLCCRCCINKVELNWTVEQPNHWDSIRLMKVILSCPSVVHLHFWIENCNLLKLHFSNQTISTWFAVFFLSDGVVWSAFSAVPGVYSSHCRPTKENQEHRLLWPIWLSKVGPTTPSKPKSWGRPFCCCSREFSCFHFHISTELHSCLTRSNTELSNVNVTLETKVHEIRAGQPPSRCYDYSSLH